MEKKDIQLFGGIAIVAIVLFTAFAAFHSVPAGHKGVEILFGKVKERALDEGMHILNPFAEVQNIDLRTQREESSLEAYTKDIQMASIQIVFTYNVNSSNTSKLYREVGKEYKDRLITPILENTVKDVVGRWEADQLIANRDQAVKEISERLSTNLDPDFIILSSVSLTGIDYSDAFEKSIEEKQIATQNAIKAQNDTVRITEEAKQRVIVAEAEAEAMSIKSRALSTNRNLIEYEAVQKWDGKLPQYTGSGPMPFIEVK